jgi:hypothetical protein
MKVHEGMEVKLRAVLIPALDAEKWSPLYLRRGVPRMH